MTLKKESIKDWYVNFPKDIGINNRTGEVVSLNELRRRLDIVSEYRR